MKQIKKKLAYSMLLAGIFANGCTSKSEKVTDAKENVKQAEAEAIKADAEVDAAKQQLVDANQDYIKEYEDYKIETNEKLLANQKSIKEFNARIEKDKTAAKAEYKAKIEALDRKNTDMKKKLDNFKANSKEDWQKFKDEFNHDMDELGNAFRDLTVNNKK